MEFNDLFHGNPTPKCAEVAQPQMIDRAKYGNFSCSSSSNLRVGHICVFRTFQLSLHVYT